MSFEGDKTYGLHYSRALPAGKKNGGSVPFVYSIRWNRDPSLLDAHRAFACASSHGIRVYQDTIQNWRLLHNKTSKGFREGLCVEWNPANLRMLATGVGCCREDEQTGGFLRLLEYSTADREFHTRKVFGPMAGGRVVGSISFSSNGHYLVAALYSCSSAVYSCEDNVHQVNRCILGVNLTSDRYVVTEIEYPNGGQEMFDIKFHPSKKDVFLSFARNDSKIWVWHRSNVSWQTISSIEVSGGVHGLSFNVTGSYFVTLGHQRINIWRFDTNTNPMISCKMSSHQLSHEYPEGALSCSWFDGRFLVIGGNKKLCFYETRRWGQAVTHVHTQRDNTHFNRVLCVDWDLTSDCSLASGGTDGYNILWTLLLPDQYPPAGALTRFYLKESTYYDPDPYELPVPPDPDLPPTDIEEDRRSLDVISTSSEGSSASIEG